MHKNHYMHDKNNKTNSKEQPQKYRFLSNPGVYKIRCQNSNRFYIGETSRNLN